MRQTPVFRRTGQEWLDRMFDCRAVEIGGVIKRQVIDVEREVGHHVLLAEVQRRGFKLIRSKAYYVVICDSGPIEMLA